MLWVKRLVTALALWFALFLVLFIGSLMVGGGVVGGRAAVENHATDFNSGREFGQEAGQEFGRKYGLLIMLGSFLASGALSAAVSFTGLLPWCRRPRTPPPLFNS